MRLTSFEVEQIKEAVLQLSPPTGTKLILYGSRVRDDLKGGDIDLLISIPDSSIAEWKEKKLKLLVEIMNRIGEQRIDISILSETHLKTDPFFKVALVQSQVIFEF